MEKNSKLPAEHVHTRWPKSTTTPSANTLPESAVNQPTCENECMNLDGKKFGSIGLHTISLETVGMLFCTFSTQYHYLILHNVLNMTASKK